MQESNTLVYKDESSEYVGSSPETPVEKPKNLKINLNRAERRVLGKIFRSKELNPFRMLQSLSIEKLALAAGPKYAKFFNQLFSKAK